jgi:hypothetical protein
MKKGGMFMIWKRLSYLALSPVLIISAYSASPLMGTNLGAWGMNNGTLNEPFVNDNRQQEWAQGVIGSIRFPARELPNEALIDMVDAVNSVDAVPLAILPSNNDDRAVHLVNLYGDKVTYYEFGNEDNWFRSWTGEYYASRWKEGVPKIRQAAPDIIIGGPVVSHIGPDGSSFVSDFLDGIAGQEELYPDYISFHLYSAHGEDKSSQAILEDVATWGARVDWLREEVRTKLGVDLPIAVTEWNWDAAPEHHDDNRDRDSDFMNEFTFAALDQWKDHGVFMSHQYGYGAGMGGNHLTMVDWNDRKPQYYAFQQYVDEGRDVLPVISIKENQEFNYTGDGRKIFKTFPEGPVFLIEKASLDKITGTSASVFNVNGTHVNTGKHLGRNIYFVLPEHCNKP